MRKFIRKILVSVLVLLVCVASIQSVKILFAPDQNGSFLITSQRVKGDPKASVQIVEYVDFRCGPCGHGSRWLKDFIKKHPGKVFLEVRYFPLHLTYGALAARFTECALKQGMFWDIHDALMGNQREWFKLSNPKSFFLEIAEKKGMDIVSLEACWDNPSVYDSIMEIKHLGKELGVTATPTYFINGKMFVGFKEMSEELLRLLGMKDETVQALK